MILLKREEKEPRIENKSGNKIWVHSRRQVRELKDFSVYTTFQKLV